MAANEKIERQDATPAVGRESSDDSKPLDEPRPSFALPVRLKYAPTSVNLSEAKSRTSWKHQTA